MSVSNTQQYTNTTSTQDLPESVDKVGKKSKKKKEYGELALRTLLKGLQPLEAIVKKTGKRIIEKLNIPEEQLKEELRPLANTLKKAGEKVVERLIPEERLANYKEFSKSNRFSMNDLSKIAEEKKFIGDLLFVAKKAAQRRQPESSMYNLITIPQEKKSHKISQQYLVSSAPKKDKKVPVFWENILKSGSRTIVSVLQPQEKNKIKSLPYWDTDRFGLKNITKLEETILQSGVKKTQLIRRLFLVENDDSTTYEIQQFHYDGWLDCKKAPDTELFSRLLQEVHARDEGVYPITVHCAAGVGRSSAFVFSHFLYKKMLEKNSISESKSEVPDENTNEEKTPETPNEPKYNLLKYMFEGMSQRKSFGSSRQITTITESALKAFKSTQDKLV